MDAIMALNQPEQPSFPAVLQANAATTDPTVLNLTQMVAALQQQINQMSGQLSAPPVPSSSTNPRTGKQWKRYCWTHGCCNHWGRDCNNKTTGHKDDATFRNRMGGSDANCLPTRN